MSVKMENAAAQRAERPLPLYEAVKRRISEEILLGRWATGMALPNENELARQFGVAQGTMRRALSDLTAEGLLTRRPKTGTVVTGRSPNHSLRFFFQYYRLHRDSGELVTSESRTLLIEHVPANALERRQLELDAAAEVIRIHRVRDVDGRPAMKETLAIVAARVPGFPSDPAQVPQLLLVHLLEAYGIRITAVREELAATITREDEQAALGLSAPTPLLEIVQTAFDQGGRPVVHAHQLCLTDTFRYVNEIS